MLNEHGNILCVVPRGFLHNKEHIAAVGNFEDDRYFDNSAN